MLILIGCEESQTICLAFRQQGHEAFSCDLQDCSGGHPQWHIKGDVFEAIASRKWDRGIFNPPCTYSTGSSIQWLSHPEDKHLPFALRRPNPRYPLRREDLKQSIQFVKDIYNCQIPSLAIENPVGLLSSLWRKPDQIIQPWQFGDEATKTTCLWLKKLPALRPTLIVNRGGRRVFSSGKSHPDWYADIKDKCRTKEEVQRMRSKTFPGIAEAMASQWGKTIEGSEDQRSVATTLFP